MNTRAIASAYRLSEWAQKLQERRARGESINAFCLRTGASRHTYFYWQRKVREAACRELLPAATSTAAQEVIPSGWAVCAPAEELRQERGVTVEIGKFRVTADTGTSPETLETVCRVLSGLC
jgi:hypothetical protein